MALATASKIRTKNKSEWEFLLQYVRRGLGRSNLDRSCVSDITRKRVTLMKSLDKRYLAGLVCIPLLALGACSSEETASEPNPGETYGSVEELRDAAMAAGLEECSEWDKAANSGNETGGFCGEVKEMSADNIGLFHFSTDAAKQNFIKGNEYICSIPDPEDVPCPPKLVGPNWIISASQAEELQPALGGVLRDG